MKNEVVMLGGRSAFDSAIRLTGAKLVVVGSVDDLSAHSTIAPRWSTRPGSATDCNGTGRDEEGRRSAAARRCRGHSADREPDLLRQDGHRPVLLLRRQGIVRAAVFGHPARTQGSDRGGAGAMQSMGRRGLPRDESRQGRDRRRAHGRGNVDDDCDLAALNKQWSRRVERIARLVETVPGVTTSITIPEGGNSYPTLTVSWDQEAFGFTVADCDRELRAGDPRIEVLTSSNPSFVPCRVRGHAAGTQAHRAAARSPADHLHDDEGRRRTDRGAAAA